MKRNKEKAVTVRVIIPESFEDFWSTLRFGNRCGILTNLLTRLVKDDFLYNGELLPRVLMGTDDWEIRKI